LNRFTALIITMMISGMALPAKAYDLTWDLGASAGSYAGQGYSELNVGLNWFIEDYLVWRNAVFARFPDSQDMVTGLDTSMRFQQYGTSDSGTFGAGFFVGPGIRFSKTDYSAMFLEGGVQLKLGGLNIGGGAKYFNYMQPGPGLSKNDTVFFLILSGGGAL